MQRSGNVGHSIYINHVYLTAIQSDAYNGLLNTIRSLPLGATAIPGEVRVNQEMFSAPAPLRPEDYPKIKYWFKRQWTEFCSNDHPTNATSGPQARGRSRAAQGINVSMQYVELEDGSTISGDRATEIRKFARAIWVSVSKTDTPPSKWGQADIQIRHQYLFAMGSRFPELRFCDLEWKTDQIATDNYPSWYTNWLGRRDTQNLKKEDGDALSLQTKRSRKASEKLAAKRIKLGDAVISDDQGGSSKEGVPTGANGSMSNVQVTGSFGDFTHMLTV
jgi:hypothetical protein